MYAEHTKTYLYIEMGTDNPEWNYKTIYEGISLHFSRPSPGDCHILPFSIGRLLHCTYRGDTKSLVIQELLKLFAWKFNIIIKMFANQLTSSQPGLWRTGRAIDANSATKQLLWQIFYTLYLYIYV